MKQAVEFLIEQAREMGIRLLTADFVDEYQPQIKPFIAAGFTRTPGAPHYLALRSWNSCSGLGKSGVKQIL